MKMWRRIVQLLEKLLGWIKDKLKPSTKEELPLELPEIDKGWEHAPSVHRPSAHRLGDRVFRVARVSPWRIVLPIIPRPRQPGLSPLLIVYGFAGMILVGTLLLTLPIASRSGDFTSPVTALFTATSAVCVTGLAVVDTGTYWSGFGQGVILFLIQIGGLGFMTSTTLLLLLLGRKLGLRERWLIGQSLGTERLGGMVKLVRRILLFTLIVEVIGAAILYLHFSTEGALGTAVWRSVFQSVSAFNNAGFDVFGDFRSLTGYQTDSLVLLTTAALVIMGGISFAVVADIGKVRRFGRFSLDTKIVLVTTLTLLTLGTLVILTMEYENPATLGPLSVPYKILNAFFQSVGPRTAGFNSLNMGAMADYSLFFTMLLMFIGGAAGSTAGGIKVNTFGMLAATVWSAIRGKERAGAFRRTFTNLQIYRALSVVALSLTFIFIVVLVLSITENFGFINILFETVSAFGTVGSTTGITPDLSMTGQLIIVATMFIGRLGPLILVLSLAQRQKPSNYGYPEDEVRIG